MSNIQLIQLSNYVKPVITENYGQKWVLNGKNNSFFQYIIDRRDGSPTNSSIINVYSKLLYGKGIVTKDSDEVYDELNEIFPKREQKKCLNDLKEFGWYAMQIRRGSGTENKSVAKIDHMPVNLLGMGKMDEKGNINEVYYCDDWTNTYKNKPKELPVYQGELSQPLMVKMIRPYKAGKKYFPDPEYLACLQYAEMEEEISNFSINHIKNGLSFGYVLNVNNGGALTPEEKDELERKIKAKLTGTTNAGKMVLSFNDSKEDEVTVYPLEVNDAHNQWESLRDEAKQQILTCHGVTSPLLFGISTSTGFSSNADELDVSSKLLQDFQINPLQELFIDELANIIEHNGLETDLEFLPLRDSYKSTEDVEVKKEVVDDTIDDEEEEDINLSKDVLVDLDLLLSKGESVDYDSWDLIDDRQCNEVTLKESFLNGVFEFASVPSGDARKRSEQDTSLFKIRYRYAGNLLPERDFCRRVMSSNKVFRSEDLENAGVVNPGLGASGSNTYNIFKYKGGVNCKHWWQRVIFLKKGNKKISVNEARKMILQLDPSERKDAKWKENTKEVAQIADSSNNYWKLN